MRLSPRKVVQVVLGFCFLLFVNVVYVIVVGEGGRVGQQRLVLVRNVQQNGELRSHNSLGQLDHVKEGLPLAPPASNLIFPTPSDKSQLSTPRPTEINDIFISVKTTQKFHSERLDLILDTWWLFARDVTYFFTDAEDPIYSKKTRGHLINTNCSSLHHRRALCCKMSVEYDTFLSSDKRWFCHVDDDTYLNIPALQRLLKQYNHIGDWYLGKPSLNHPLEITDIDNPQLKSSFWFATGGAGFCISRGLALKMMPFTGGGKLKTVCEKLRLPDDCTLGFIISHYLKTDLTVIRSFHSHLEGLYFVNEKNLENTVSVSYARMHDKMNVVDIGGFPLSDDPTRFRSIHCLLNPYLKGCPPPPQPRSKYSNLLQQQKQQQQLQQQKQQQQQQQEMTNQQYTQGRLQH